MHAAIGITLVFLLPAKASGVESLGPSGPTGLGFRQKTLFHLASQSTEGYRVTES
jgi:hypothetical protein